MRPIKFHKIPQGRIPDVAHSRVVCEVRPTKSDPNRTRITIGGNTIGYLGDTGTKTGSIEVVKGVINSVCSQPKAKFLTADIDNFYLNTPLDRPEYVRIKIDVIPQEFIEEYNLMAYVHNGWVYFEITKGIYGLKQAGKLANDLLTERLAALFSIFGKSNNTPHRHTATRHTATPPHRHSNIKSNNDNNITRPLHYKSNSPNG